MCEVLRSLLGRDSRAVEYILDYQGKMRRKLACEYRRITIVHWPFIEPLFIAGCMLRTRWPYTRREKRLIAGLHVQLALVSIAIILPVRLLGLPERVWECSVLRF